MNRDKILGLSFALIGLMMLILTQQIHVLANLTEPGPRLFPRITAIGLIVCGLGVAFVQDKKGEASKDEKLNPAVVKKIGLIGLTLVFYLVCLTYIGFIISTPIAMMCFIYVLRNNKKISLIKSIILAIIVTVLVYLLFIKVFELQLPIGKLF